MAGGGELKSKSNESPSQPGKTANLRVTCADTYDRGVIYWCGGLCLGRVGSRIWRGCPVGNGEQRSTAGGGGTCPGDGGYWRRSSPLRPLLGHDLGGVQEKVMNHSECLGGVPLAGGAPAE